MNLFNNKDDAFQIQPIACESVEKFFKTLRNDCSTDYDHIPISFIIPVTSISPMIFILNNFIEVNLFPDVWKVIRIFITNQTVELKDYRSISMLPALSKIYVRLF